MILAAPLVPLFAQAAGITAGGLGMIGLTKKVSDYIRQNPEESKEIIKLISPGAAGISTLFENKKREEDKFELYKDEIINAGLARPYDGGTKESWCK